MQTTSKHIAKIPLFKGLPTDQVEALTAIAVPRTVNRGEAIFAEGEAGSGFFVVVQGSVKVYKVSVEGKEQILHIFGPGEPIGEVPVFSGQRFPAHAQAIAASRLLFFPREQFVALIAANPSLALNMLAMLSLRLRRFTRQIENLSLKEVPGRLAAYLLYLCEESGRSDAVELAISKGQLASLLGTIPETLSRILARMSGQRLIEVNGKAIRILDFPGLELLAETGRLAE